ncbi:MAG: sulfatase [Acidobacteriota bacterium]|nr:MAG: sulfatase [Acidobacteriota bacterium]
MTPMGEPAPLLPRRARWIGFGLLLVLAAAGLFSACSSPPRIERPNIVLITLDTTRRDRLGVYGCPQPTSPQLDRMAAESVVYTRAVAPSNWTLPAHASLFTGKFTTSHGARFDSRGPLTLAGQLSGSGEFWSQFRARGLAADEPTLAALLQRAGYATGGVAAGPWLKRAFGLQAGFAFYDDENIGTENGRPAPDVNAAALKFLEQRAARPFFLFVNYFDPHFPYQPPEAWIERFRPHEMTIAPVASERSIGQQRVLYDAEIAYMDHHLGQLLDRLRRDGLYDQSWIIVTSDHGEMLGEHGRMGHGHRLYQQEIHIPLVMKYPHGEQRARRTDVPIQLTELAPMILERLALERPPEMQGGVPPEIGHPLIAEVYPLEALSQDGDTRAIFDGSFKFVWNAKGQHALYDLGDDPGELKNLLDEHPERARSMSERLESFLARLPKPPPPGEQQIIDEQTQRALRELGYLD